MPAGIPAATALYFQRSGGCTPHKPLQGDEGMRSFTVTSVALGVVAVLLAPLAGALPGGFTPKAHFSGFQGGSSDGATTTLHIDMRGFAFGYGDFTVTLKWEKPAGTVLYTSPGFFVEDAHSFNTTLDIPVAARPGVNDVLTATVEYMNGKTQTCVQPGTWVPGLVATTRVATSAVFTDLGSALAGLDGEPDLVGLGELVPGQDVSLRVMNARPGAAAAMVVGSFAANLPYAGGTLVPWPDVVLAGLSIDAAGCLVLAAAVPEGLLPGQSVVVQCWITDDGGPAGYAATNGIMSTVP
jgi:hypothetical protein